jgi:membrane protease YdiL (CAAX protease family)
MKSTITLYRIFSYFLLIIAAFLGIGLLAVLFIALANPAMLLNVFVAAAVVMYSISSFLFLINGIDGKKQLKPGLKDFIRVNAFVALFFCVMNIFQSVTVIMNPSILGEAINQMPQLTTGQQLPKDTILKVLRGSMWFLLFYSLILMAHIQICFRLLKQYSHLFGKKASY